MSTILVIEDETQIRVNLQEILEVAEYTVLTAADGATGLQLAKVKIPDLIICDVMMPGISGYEVLQKLRNEPKLANIPLIFLTAMAERTDVRQGMNLGADDYITKPFKPSEILQAVQVRLERHSLSTKQYLQQSQKAEKLQQEFKKNQNQLENSQQLAHIRGNILQQLSQDLRNPLSNINMAIHMLKQAKTENEREHYLAILQEECAREIQILNEVDSLQSLLTDENTKLLQHFKLLDS